jgi:methylenetetrahydrofolate dehydrogenase (NAD+)
MSSASTDDAAAAPAATAPPPGRKILASEIAEPFRAEIRAAIASRYAGAPPKLVGLLGNDDPAARKYAQWTGRAAAADGIAYELREVAGPSEMELALERVNEDPTVAGVMVYYPVFGNQPSFYGSSMDDYLRDTISVQKDVEGLCYTYRNKLYRNQRYLDTAKQKKCILPCTPLACVKILESLHCYDPALPVGNRMEGRTVTIINRSEIVGRPLAAMLANDGASVYSVDIDSIFLMQRGKLVPTETSVEQAVRESSIVITGVPTKEYRLPAKLIQPNTTVINVASFKNCDESELLAIPGV